MARNLNEEKEREKGETIFIFGGTM